MTTLVEIIGKFHPLLLHLPIGVMIYAYLHLGYDLFVNKNKNKNVVNIHFALGLGALTAILSSVSGYILSGNGEYGGELLDWHKWLGIGTSIGAILLFFVYKRIKSKKQFFGLFSLFMILLGVTGHYGGSLTHGEGFLSSSPQDDTSNIIEDIPKAHVFNDLVMPIVKRKCVSCHNPKKTKGELLLNTLEGWKKGGKTGDFIIAGDVENSLMLTKIHLPISEKEHMPPSGKLQLDKDEMVFLEWWIKSMSNYEEKVEELSPPENIMKYINRKLDASTRNIPPIDNASIVRLQNAGIPVQLLRKDQPWLAVAYDRGQTVKKGDIQKLLKYKENVRELVMSKTNLTDKMLSKIKEFTNLRTLDISQNQITSKGIMKLKNLNSLENLNLYGTAVDSKMLNQISSFPALQNLYLWQTNITKSDIASADLPKDLEINMGQDLDVFGDVKLAPPVIESEKEIFVDSMSITLSHVAENAKIRYTLNGEVPYDNSPLYTQPIKLENTCELKAISSMDGWVNSEVVTKSFLKSSSIPVACNIIPAPNDKYKADGNVTLINAVKGSEQFGDGKWLGFSGQDVSITLDLGEVKEIEVISYGSLQDYVSYIFNPIASTISVSSDGDTYQKIKEEKYKQITGPDDSKVKNYIFDLPTTNARFVKLDIVAQKKNPSWHADPGADAWLFLDEIVVE